MTLLRATGIAMLLIQGGVLWLTMGYLPISILTVVVALLGCWGPLQHTWHPSKRYLADGAIVLAYVLWWWVHLQHVAPRSQQYTPNMSLAGALALMMLQAIRFYRRPPETLGLLFPFFGVLALACAGDAHVSMGRDRQIFDAGALLFGILAVVYFALHTPARVVRPPAHRVYRFTILALCLALSLALATGTAWTLNHSDRFVGGWLMRSLAVPQRIALGNTSTARLGSMTDFDGSQAEQIALEIIAEASPGYLRGQVFDTYESAAWHALPRETAVTPWKNAPPPAYAPASPAERLFPVDPANEITQTMTVFPDKGIRRALFTPENTAWVALATDTVLVNDAGIVETDDDLAGRAYRTLTAPPGPTVPLSEEERATYTHVPDHLAERVTELSNSVCADRDTPLGKALAVVQYFSANYEYSLDFQTIRQEEPLAYFLFGDPLPNAHCEYFASGATMLLRAAGVPARYVTGVGVWEQHALDGYWIARNRDAHAWCEAWDPEEGWFLVEATPASGLPENVDGGDTSSLREFASMLSLQFRRLWTALREGSWRTAAASLLAAMASLGPFLARHGWWILPAGLAIVAAIRLLRHGRGRRRRSRKKDHSALDRRLNEQLSAMDRFLDRKYRKRRRPHETIHHFAQLLEHDLQAAPDPARLADWYRHWAEARYRPRTAPADLDALEQAASDLRKPRA